MAKAIGIDLGTTNSVVSVMEGGKPVVITNPEGSRLTPSVVGFTKTGERLIGQLAKRQAVSNPDRTIASIKRHMGEKDYKVSIDGKDYTPPEISAMILQKLKADAEAYLGETVTRVSTSCASSTSRRRLRWPMVSTRAASIRFSSLTWAAARSTSRSSNSARAWSRSRRRAATRTWAATTLTTPS